jgi:hypothetical protein
VILGLCAWNTCQLDKAPLEHFTNQYFSTAVSLFILFSASKYSHHYLNDNQIIKERMAEGLIATSNVDATPFLF